MPSSHPTTREDFIAVGQRFVSEDLVAEIDRLAPIARADLPKLLGAGYEASDLDELLGYRAELSKESAERRKNRGTKKAARDVELKAVREGKRVLRIAVVALQNALAKRKPAPREKAETTVQLTQTLASQIDALGGRVGLDSAKLRTRLVGATALLGSPELAPHAKEAKAERQKLVASVHAAVEKLPGLAETKHALQEAALEDTAALDEIDGRAYENMKRLCAAGRVTFFGHKRASEYQLDDLHTRTHQREATAPPPPAPANPQAPAPAS